MSDSTSSAASRPGLLGAPRRWIRQLYDWTIAWSERPSASVALFLIAFAESSVFPIPPDVLLVAMVVGTPLLWLRSAALCTAGSALGGLLGYAIGHFLMETVGARIVAFYHAEQHWQRVVEAYQGEFGIWFLAVAAFTPIPYKVATIAAGATEMPLLPFVLTSVIGRGARFFLVASLLRAFGAPVRRFIERYFDWLALAFAVLLVGGFFAVKLLL